VCVCVCVSSPLKALLWWLLACVSLAIVSLQPWASHHCLPLLSLMACCYSNTRQAFTSACVCVCVRACTFAHAHSVCHRHQCMRVLCGCVKVYLCVCVCVCCPWSKMVKKSFYYVLVGRLGIITQAWLSTYNVV